MIVEVLDIAWFALHGCVHAGDIQYQTTPRTAVRRMIRTMHELKERIGEDVYRYLSL